MATETYCTLATLRRQKLLQGIFQREPIPPGRPRSRPAELPQDFSFQLEHVCDILPTGKLLGRKSSCPLRGLPWLVELGLPPYPDSLKLVPTTSLLPGNSWTDISL